MIFSRTPLSIAIAETELGAESNRGIHLMAEKRKIGASRGAAPTDRDVRILEQALAGAPVGVLLEGVGGRVLWRNEALAEALGAVDGAADGRVEALTARAAERSLECTRVVLAPDRTAGARGRVRAVRYFVPVSEAPVARGALLRLLDARPGLDPETGVLDAAGINRALQTEVSRSRRYGNPLSVVVLRTASALRGVARMLKEELRWADLIGRIEERALLVVLPESDAEAANHLVAKVRGMLARDAATHGRAAAQLGAAEWRRGDDSDALLRRACEALEERAAIT